MAKIFIFGSSTIGAIPGELLTWLAGMQYDGGLNEIIIRDKGALSKALQMKIASMGLADRATIYSMKTIYDNPFGLKEKMFKTEYNEETKEAKIYEEDKEIYSISEINKEDDIEITREWYEYLDRRMVDECDIAICIWDGQSKTEDKMITLLNIKNKQYSVLRVA